MGKTKLGQREIAFIVIGVTVLAAVGWYFLIYQPGQDQLRRLESSIQQLETQRQRGIQARNNIAALERAVAELQAQRDRFFEALPTTEQMSAVIDTLQANAAQTRVTLANLARTPGSATDLQPRAQPGTTAARAATPQVNLADVVQPFNVNIAVSGNFAAIFNYLLTIEDMTRFTKVRNLAITGGSGIGEVSDPELSSNLQLQVYTYTGQQVGGTTGGTR